MKKFPPRPVKQPIDYDALILESHMRFSKVHDVLRNAELLEQALSILNNVPDTTPDPGDEI